MLAQRVRQRSGELPGRVLSGGTQAMDGDSAYKSVLPPASPWVKVMVTVDRPPAERLARHNRREKIQILEENAAPAWYNGLKNMAFPKMLLLLAHPTA
jgi:hypothetical protein